MAGRLLQRGAVLLAGRLDHPGGIPRTPGGRAARMDGDFRGHGTDPHGAEHLSRAGAAQWRGRAPVRKHSRDGGHFQRGGGQLSQEAEHLPAAALHCVVPCRRGPSGEDWPAVPCGLAGGLGLTTDQFGTIYGTFGTLAFVAGSILGGYFTSWLGLRRALLPLVCAMNFPNLAYVYLSTALPTSHLAVTAALSVEMFGYGFGFVGVILLMMQEIAPGKYQTAHYAFANSLMNLGLLIPGTVSGKIQLAVGYRNFFVWVLLSSIPALILSRLIPIRGGASSPAVSPEPVEETPQWR